MFKKMLVWSMFALMGVSTVKGTTITIGSTSYSSLQAAINASQSGDVIQLGAGTFGSAETNAIVMTGKTNVSIRGQGIFATTFSPAAVSRRLNPSSSNPLSTPWAFAGGGYWPKPSNTFDDVPNSTNTEPWRPYIYIANSTGVKIENIGFDFASVTGTNRAGNNVAISGILAHNITGMVFSNVSVRGMSTLNNINQETPLAFVNDSAPYSVTNKGTVSIFNGNIYNPNRGVRARWFVNLTIRNTLIQKSPLSDTLASALGIDAVTDLTFENSLISGFNNPFNIWQSTAFLINNNYKWPGYEAYINSPPTQTVNIVNSTISDAAYGLYIVGSWTPRALVVNITNSIVKDNTISGIYVTPGDAVHFSQNRTTVNIANTEISGNGSKSSTGSGIWHGPDYPRNSMNITGSTFTNNAVYDYYAAQSINSNGTLSVFMRNNRFGGANTLRIYLPGTSTYDVSGNYYGSSNPDIMDKWLETVPVPAITNIYTDFNLTSTRRTLAVCPTCPFTSLSAAVSSAVGDDLIYVFDAPVLTNTLTIASNRTIWTRSGISFTNAGAITVNSGRVLTLDGVDITGPITITTNTVGILTQSAPVFQANGTSIEVRGTVAWTPCFVDVFALVSPTNTAPAGNQTNGWTIVRKLTTFGMRTGNVSGLITNLASNVTYTVQLVGIVSTNLPATPFGLTHASMGRFAVNVNNCNKTADYWCGWRTGQHYTQLVAYASTTNSSGGFWLEAGDTVWNDDAPLGYPAGSPSTITWGSLKALVDAGQNMPGLYVNPLPRIPIPLDDPRSISWNVYLNNANQCNGSPLVPPGQESWGQWKLWQVLFSYADLTNAVRTNACFAAGQGNITLYNNTFSDWSDYNKLRNEVNLYGNEIRLTQSSPIPCAGAPNIYSSRRNVRPIGEVAVTDVITGGTTNSAAVSNINVNVQVDAGQTVTVNVYSNQISGVPFASVTLTNSGTPSFDSLLTVDGLYFIQTIRTSSDGTSTNSFAVNRRTYAPNSTFQVGMAFDFGVSNTMGGELGIQFGNGLRTPGLGEQRDSVYVQNTNGIWRTFEWTGSGWVGLAGASTNERINASQGFFLITSPLGTNRVAIYRAVASAGGISVNIPSGLTLRTWPLPFSRTQLQGWGFTGATRSDNMNSADQITMDGRTMFLKRDGRWYYNNSPSTVATNLMTPNKTFHYRARAAFTWTPQ